MTHFQVFILIQVLFLTDSDVFAGTERHIFDLASALKRDFADQIVVRVACPAPSPLEEKCRAAPIVFTAIPKRGPVGWNAVRTLRRLLRSRKVDLIHAHNGRTALAAALAVTLARRGALVTTQHFLSPNHTTQSGLKSAISLLGHRFVNRRAKNVVAISRAVQDAMRARGEANDRSVIVLNGVPDSRHRVLENANEVRQKFDATERPLIVCASRLQSEKGLDVLIAAMKIVVETKPDTLCLLAGEGNLQNELQAQIERAKLTQNVRLVGFQNDVTSLVEAADIFVLPSLNEPFGLSLIEAMSLGKAVIATNVGGPLEIVEHEKSGVLVAPSSSKELAQAISRLLDDQKLRERLGEAARARYENCFTVERMAREIATVYQGAVKV